MAIKMTNKIKVYRAIHDMTQGDLADKVNVTRQTIIAVEKNKYVPSLKLAFKIALVFNEQIEKIFEYSKK